jgi:hypothetical protein
LISEIIPDMTNDKINPKNTVWSIILNEQLIFDGGLSSKYCLFKPRINLISSNIFDFFKKKCVFCYNINPNIIIIIPG